MAKVTVYTKNNCPQCDMTKKVLNMKKVEYQTVNVEEDERALEHLKSQGFMQVPVVEIENGEMFSGFQPNKLDEIQS